MAKTKKKKQVLKKKIVQKKETASSLDKLVSQDFSAITIGIIVLLISLIHFGYSYLSNGFYQGEEAIHYMNMKKFWHEPSAILGNWGKPGWKLMVILPALGGFKFLAFFNAIMAAGAAWLAYKIAQLKKVRMPIIAFVLLAGQFLWMEMAFRNYSEFPTALLLTAAIYAHLKGKLNLAGLLLSYTLTMRQELLPVAGLYALYLLYAKKAWLPVILISVFPLLFNFWGFLVTGDPLYTYTNAVELSKAIMNRYPRMGFDHYIKTALPIYGPFVLVGLFAYLKQVFTRERTLDYFVFIPLFLFWLVHSLFNLQAFNIGAPTGGNWRYLLIISPLLTILATIGWDKLPSVKLKDKLIYLLFFLPFLVYAISVNSFEHNYIGFSTVKDWVLPGTFAATIVLAMLPLSRGPLAAGIVGLTLLFNYIYLKPIKMVGEDAKMKEIAAWVEKENIDDNPIYHSNLMLNVFMDKNEHEFEKGIHIFKSAEELENAPVGSHIFWDTHYSKRYSELDYTYFQTKPDLYQVVKQEQSDNKRYAILIFKKIK